MARIRAPSSKNAKSNVPITRIGKKQYLKRRFNPVRQVENAGKDNKLTQEYNKRNCTAAQNYARLGLAIDPSLSDVRKQQQKAVVKKQIREKFKEPELKCKGTLGQPVSEQEGCMLCNLMNKYGTNLKGMSLDYKLNPFQLTPRQLQRRIVNYLRVERAAFPEQYAEAEASGWLDDYTSKRLRTRKLEQQDEEE